MITNIWLIVIIMIFSLSLITEIKWLIADTKTIQLIEIKTICKLLLFLTLFIVGLFVQYSWFIYLIQGVLLLGVLGNWSILFKKMRSITFTVNDLIVAIIVDFLIVIPGLFQLFM